MSGPQKKAWFERLLAERKITAAQAKAAFAHAEQVDGRIEDALIDTGAVDETQLLKWIAAVYKTRFVSTDKLSKADIERTTLALIPRGLAEQLCVFPVVFDKNERSLAFVLADPEDQDIPQQVKLVAKVASVKAYIARPAAIRAAIQKHYRGDIHAFGKVDSQSYAQFKQMMDTYERNMLDEDTFAQRGNTGLYEVSLLTENQPVSRGATTVQESPGNLARGATIVHDSTPLLRGATIEQEMPYERTFDADELERAAKRNAPSFPNSITAKQAQPPLPPGSLPRKPSLPQSGDEGASFGSSAELVNVLVSLLENQRQELRGHSAQVARLMQKVGEHMGLEPSDVYALRLCGLLHDVGKTSSYHLTALNVAEYEGHRAQAKKCFMSPVRLFEAASLPKLCAEGLTSVYERFDGQGFPDRRAGKDIPLGARLLAIAETYADLTSNARNPFRKTLSAKAAVEVLGRYKDKIFDANLVDLFRVAALGEDMQSSLLNDRPRILLVDADAEETTVLELRLVEQGHEVVLCRTAEQAYKRFQQGGIDAVITEVDLKPHDGFTLVEYIRKNRSGSELPVLFLTRRSDRASVDRGFQLGAVDYIIKPAAPDVVVAKARNVLAKAARQRGTRGVSGSLREMPLPDVLQVLSRTKKTGLLKVSGGGYAGEIQFGNGAICNATFMNMRGADAVYSLLALQDGDFTLDPSFVPSSRGIHETTEQLLLEGMRRMDESGLGAGDGHTPVDFSSTRIDEG